MAKSKLYESGSKEKFRISRTGIEKYIQCPLCFVLKVKHGLKDLSSIPFTLNAAVDTQLKKEYDFYRERQVVPPIAAEAGLKLIPFRHDSLNDWRSNFKGVEAETEDFRVFGAVDDIWCDNQGQLYVVDYKATSRQEAVKELGVGGFYDAYRRQMEVYQWLLSKNGFTVSNRGYWLYATATKKEPMFDGKLIFEQNLVSYDGNVSWIEPLLKKIKMSLDSEILPSGGTDCDTCRYINERNRI